MTGTVAIVATLETKGRETAFLKEGIEALGCATLVIDVGVFDPEGITPDISRHDIAAAAGSMAVEALIGQGVLQGVLDLSLHEFVDWLHGGYCRAIGPAHLHDRLFVKHDFRSLVRSSREGMARTAATAEKANRAGRSPTFLLPLRGWSSLDAPGRPF